MRFQGWLEANRMIHPDDLARIEAEVAAEIADAVAFAEAGTWEPVEQLTRFTYAEQAGVTRADMTVPPVTIELTYRDAVREAIRDALRRDDRVFLMGEDVGRYGGCYAVSKGLLAEFGPERIRDTPLSESGFTGAGHRRGDGRHAADRRADDGEFQPARARPDPQHRGHDPPHVGQPVRRAAGHPHGDRRRPPARGPAFAQPRRLVRAYPGHQGAGAGDARGRARHAVDGAAGPRPGADLRERHALQHDRHARGGRRRGRHRQGGGPARRARHLAHHLWRLAVEDAGGGRRACRREHRRRGDRPAQLAAARRRDHHGLGEQDPASRHRRRGLAQRQPGRRNLHAHRRAGILGARRADRPRLQRGGADPLPAPPRGGGDPAGRQDRRGRQGRARAA